MIDNDFVPFEAPKVVTDTERNEALAFLKQFENRMKYDSVRGNFSVENISSIKEGFDVKMHLNALGMVGGTVSNDSVYASKENSLAISQILKEANFNFPGVKDITSSEKGVG